MPSPYGKLVSDEVARAEADLSGFRSRSLTVITTSAGLVTVLTGIVAFAASKQNEESGVPSEAVVLSGIALAAFVVAAMIALLANVPRDIDTPDADDLLSRTSKEKWRGDDGDDELELERVATEVLATYLISLRASGENAARSLAGAIAFQVLGLLLLAVAATVTMASL